MRKDLVYVIVGSALPAIGNFIAVVFALRYIDATLLGRSYALLALFFVSIDAFNFGSARLLSVTSIRERFPSLLFLDGLSAIGSTVLLIAGAAILSRNGAVALPHFLPMLLLAPIGYAMSHSALGYLRLNSGNGAICVISTISALSRCAVIGLVVTNPAWLACLPDLLLMVEGTYGAMLLIAYLALRRPVEHSMPTHVGFSAFANLTRLGGKELLSSWYSNAIFSGAKHADVIVASMLLGPAGAALYRGAKSIHNLAFNLGQALALVLHSKTHVWLSKLTESKRRLSMPVAIRAGGLLTALFVVWAIAAVCAYKIRLFPTAALGTASVQCLFLFLIFAGATFMFACRMTSLSVFSISKRSFVMLSTMEVATSLGLLSCLCVLYGVVGAALSVVIACACVLGLSLVVIWLTLDANAAGVRTEL